MDVDVTDRDGDVRMEEAQDQEPNSLDTIQPERNETAPDTTPRDISASTFVDVSRPADLPSDWREEHSPTSPAPNGFYRNHSPSPDYHRRPSRIWSPTPPREVNGYAKTFETKVELLDSVIPNGLVAPARGDSDSPVDVRSQRARSHSPVYRAASPSPVTPHASPKLSHSRLPLVSHPSQEDGEILSPPPPKPFPLAPPRSHSPPTHPRHFYSPGGLSPPRPSPGSLSQSSVRTPLHPAYHARNSPASASRLPPPAPPSAPRALRQGGAYGGSAYSGGGGQNAPYYAAPPRGPSADRDRDRDRGRDWGRERDRDADRVWHPGPSRGRGRSGSWR